MSAGAFVAGAALGGLRYGLVRLQLAEREGVVSYSVAQAREALFPTPKHRADASERYAALPSHEHEYYTAVRERWNGAVLGFRAAVLDLFQAPK